MSNSRFPFSFRGILDGGKKEVLRLEREYQYWVLTTIFSGIAGFLSLLSVFWLFAIDINQEYLVLRIFIGIATILDFSIMYFVLLETQRRRSYLLEVKKLMQTGVSFLDAIKQTFRRE